MRPIAAQKAQEVQPRFDNYEDRIGRSGSLCGQRLAVSNLAGIPAGHRPCAVGPQRGDPAPVAARWHERALAGVRFGVFTPVIMPVYSRPTEPESP